MKAKKIMMTGLLVVTMFLTACGSKGDSTDSANGNVQSGDSGASVEATSGENKSAGNVTAKFEVFDPDDATMKASVDDYTLEGGDSIDTIEITEGFAVDGYTITDLMLSFCAKSDVRKVVINDSEIVEIKDSAFEDNTGLEEVSISNVATMGERVFYGCTNLKKMYLGEGLTSLGLGIAGKCEKLEEIHVPASLTAEGCDFGNMGLSYCPDVVIYTPAGSDMEAWANENGFKVVNE